MSDPLLLLGPSELRAIASGLRSGRLSSPYAAIAIRRFVSSGEAEEVASCLRRLAGTGSSAAGIAETLEILAAEIEQRPALEELVDVVVTGPQVAGSSNRDTSAVVGDLFRQAEASVIVVGYSVHQGQKVFLDLARRMQSKPELKARMFLDIKREIGDTSAPGEIVRRFAHHFQTTQWPVDKPLPEIYFDPRALATDPRERSAIHAKCVIVDQRELFVSSANFTEAAQTRNIEIGLLVRSPKMALRLAKYFENLVGSGLLSRAL